jgi:hypothetical protein
MTLFGAGYFAAGQRLTGAKLQALASQIDSLTAPGWTSYGSWTTLLTASTTNPTQGSSTVAAYYRKPANSDICDFQYYLNINTGGGFNAGSGTYKFLLPFTAAVTEGGAFHVTINEAGVALRVGASSYADTTHLTAWYDASGGAVGSGGLSTSWTTGDWLRITGSYWVA